MVDRNNLNRVKGILSARQGAEIPKFQEGAKFAKTNGKQVIYSKDNNSWFTDHLMTNAYTDSLSGFKSIPVPQPTMQIPGDPKLTPTSAVEHSAEIVSGVALERDKETAQTQASNAGAIVSGQSINEPATPITTSKANMSSLSSVSMNPSAGLNIKSTTSDKSNKIINGFETKQNLGQIASSAFQGIGEAVGAQQNATDSNLTKTADTAYDGIANAAEQFGPVGKLVGTAMKTAAVAGDLIQGMGGGTDQQTKMDKWMDSSFFSWNIGMLNGFAGKNTQDFGADQDILATVGSSYGGATDAILDASEKAGKKYGLFSTRARKKADAAINKARSQQNTMGDIADTATDQRLAVQSMGEQAGLAYALMTGGGYDQKYTYAAKHGGLLEWNPVIELEWEPQVELNWELPVFKEGGNIDIVEELEWIPEFKSGNKIRTIEELIEYAKQKNPRFIQRLSEEPKGIKFIDDEGNEAEGSHYLESRGEYVVPRIQEINGELKFLSPQEAIDRAMESGNYLEMTPEEAILFAEKYKQGWPEFFKKFKKGGSVGDSEIPEIEETTQKNVIPEGALHKNKHHMEHAEGLTKKGIPVIDDDGEQQAEIEHSEIIFTLEVTKKLEEYYEIFYSDESSNKEKEQAALDAGKLLVYQILENTEDRTGLIDSCKKGGTLTLKKSTDDLIEEALEWVPTIIIVDEKEDKDEKKEEKSDKELMKEAIKEVLIELLIK